MAGVIGALVNAAETAKNDLAESLGFGPRAFGPILHFRGRHGDNWHVTVSVGANAEETDVRLSAGQFVAAKSDFTLEQSSKPYKLHNMDLVVPMTAAAQVVSYSCTLPTKGDRDFSFVVPAAAADPTTLYYSCNDLPIQSLRELPHNSGKQYGAWKWIRSQNCTPEAQTKPDTVNLIIGGGDNIYADDVFVIGGQDDGARILDYYIGEYIRRFNKEDPDMGHCIASIPVFMQCDDHDYYNGFGSYTDKRRLHAETNKAAHVARLAFQLGIPSTATIKGDREVLDNTTRAIRLGPKVAMLSLDMRSNRDVTKKTLLPVDSVFVPKLKEAEKLVEDPATDHLIVLFAAPVIWTHDKCVELRANVLKHFPGAAVFATDTLDEMRASNNEEEVTVILHKLFASAKQHKCRLTFISGDVHNAAYGTLRAEGITDANDFRYAQQWISSPLCNVPDEVSGLELMKKKLLKEGDRKDAGVQFEFGADPNGKEGKLLAQLDDLWMARRNYLIVGTQGKDLYGQLYLNKEGSETEFEPTPTRWLAQPTAITAQSDNGCCTMM